MASIAPDSEITRPVQAQAWNDGRREGQATGVPQLDQQSVDRKVSITPTQQQFKRRRVADSARVRAARACQRCRRLKEKCDGQYPCNRCFRSGRTCEFTPVGTTSAFIASAAAQSSKTNPSVFFCTAAGSAAGSIAGSSGDTTNLANGGDGDIARSEERVKCLELLVYRVLGDIPMDLNNLRRILSEKVRQKARTASEIGTNDRPGPEDLEDLTLEDENFTVKTLSQSTAHYSGEFSHWNFSQKLRRRLSQCLDWDMPVAQLRLDARNPTAIKQPSSRGPPNKTPGMRILEYWRATQFQSPKSVVQGILSCLPPRAVANFLVYAYFEFAQVNCFYVQETWLRKKLDFLYEASGHVTSEDSAWVCVVLTVLAIGTQFAHMAAGRTEGAEPDSIISAGCKDRGLPISVHDSDSEVGVTFYQMASKLIPDVITIASMESVQAFLLLSHYALPLDAQGLAYTYLGLSIKMAIQNGMHRKYTGSDLDSWTVETRNRLWWMAYTVERRVSVLHGRPSSIAPTEVDAELPQDLPEFRPDHRLSTFTSMSTLIDLSLRLGEASNAITLLRRCPKGLQPIYFGRLVDICQSLHAWWSRLSSETQHPTPSSPRFRSCVHLKLCLYLYDIFVGRPFIFSQPSASFLWPWEASSSADTTRRWAESKDPLVSAQVDSVQPRRPAALAERAVEAALKTTALLGLLHESTGLAMASYIEFTSCRAALLVMLAQSVNGPQSPKLKSAIESGMQLIRRMAIGSNVSVQSDTSVVEALETAVRRLHEMQEARDMAVGAEADAENIVEIVKDTDAADAANAGQSGYERFRQWASLWPDRNKDEQNPDTGPGRNGSAFAFPDTAVSSPFPAAGPGITPNWPGPTAAMIGQSPESSRWESSRWMAMMDDASLGVGIEQLDDLGFFGSFPEFGALDGWSSLV